MSTSTSSKSPAHKRTAKGQRPSFTAPMAMSALPSGLVNSAIVVECRADQPPMLSISGAPPVPGLLLTNVTREQVASARATQTPVVVAFLDGDASRPVIVGVLADPAAAVTRTAVASVDGKRVELTGHEEVVLTCGKASITLTKAGKVIIKGAYVSASATGVNRITGSSVQIN